MITISNINKYSCSWFFIVNCISHLRIANYFRHFRALVLFKSALCSQNVVWKCRWFSRSAVSLFLPLPISPLLGERLSVAGLLIINIWEIFSARIVLSRRVNMTTQIRYTAQNKAHATGFEILFFIFQMQ
jgi:hypothetical protein